MSELRLKSTMNALQRKGEKAFVAFLTLGFPNLKTTVSLMEGMEKAGVDVIELGFPFSDPLADGPTIQRSSQDALDKGVGIEDAFAVVKQARQKGIKTPVIFFTYLNPVLNYGYQRFVEKAKKSGFDGLLIPDLPPEEEPELKKVCKAQKFPQIYLMAPTTTKERAKKIAQASDGFIYYVSLRGVTGARKSVPSDIRGHLNGIKKVTKKPLLIGFGVSSPEQAKKMARLGDGVIVGSAIVNRLRESKGKVKPVERLISQLVKATKKV